ncbi:hypothetical protein [Rhizobium leguminosarum]
MRQAAGEPPGKAALILASAVLYHSKPLADAVLSGMKPLDVAYQEAVKAKQAADSEAARLDRQGGSIRCGRRRRADTGRSRY